MMDIGSGLVCHFIVQTSALGILSVCCVMPPPSKYVQNPKRRGAQKKGKKKPKPKLNKFYVGYLEAQKLRRRKERATAKAKLAATAAAPLTRSLQDRVTKLEAKLGAATEKHRALTDALQAATEVATEQKQDLNKQLRSLQ
jgi:hypothetical protein